VALLLALPLALVVVLVGCGGEAPSPESVVRAWSQAVNDGDNEAAAELFAPGAEVVQPGSVETLSTEAEAEAFNESLRCAARIVALETAGKTVTATFVLAHRETSRCDGRGDEVKTMFRVENGKIVLWHQLPSDTSPAETRRAVYLFTGS